MTHNTPALLILGTVLWLALAGVVLLAAVIHAVIIVIMESIGDMIERVNN